MSHTTEVEDTIFHHGGGFDGVIEIQRSGTSILVPFDHLKYLVAEYVRREKISRLENAHDEEILGV